MAYDPAETEARDFVRGRVGDTADPPQLEGGETRYDAIVARYASLTTAVTIDGRETTRGAAYAVAEAAESLANQIRLGAKSIGSAGDSLTLFDPSHLDELAARYRAIGDELAAPDAAASGARVGLILAGRTNQLR